MICANIHEVCGCSALVRCSLGMTVATQGQTAPPKAASKAKAAAKAVLDLNKATAEELEADLPGVGPATAKKIIAGRPYASVDDLAKAGVSRRVIEGIRDHVTLGARRWPKTPKPPRRKRPRHQARPRAKGASTGKVNLNTADVAALEDLPGIGPATAKAIVEGRPWKSVDELDKIRGLGKARIAALKDLVTFGDRAAPTPAAKAAAEHRSPPADRGQDVRKFDQGHAQAPARPEGQYQHRQPRTSSTSCRASAQ